MRLRRREGKMGGAWYIDYVDRAGKRRRHTLKGITTKRSAELALAQFRLKLEREQMDLPVDENLALSDALDALVTNRRLAGCSQGWLVRLKSCRNHLEEYFGAERRLMDLSDTRIAQYRIARLDEDVAVETVNKELKTLAAAGRLAVQQNKLTKLPWHKIDLAIDRTGKEVWNYLTEDETKKLLHLLRHGGERQTIEKKNGRSYSFEVQPSPRLWAIVTFLLNTGARKGEMFALRWSDVNTENRTVRLVGSKSAKNGKSAKARYIPMNEELLILFNELERGAPSDVVFPMEKNLRKKFSQSLRWAGLRHFRIHDLRHTFASHLAMKGVALYTIAQLLGHSSTEITTRYAHLSPENMASAVQLLGFGASHQDKAETSNTPQAATAEDATTSDENVSSTLENALHP